MGVTSNYSFPVPVATDLVKNGWDAINDLGVAVDTAMNTALATKKAGMVLLNTTSFSGAVSQSFGSDASPIFTSAYTNYKILIDDLDCATSAGALLFRVRANTTDLSGSVYNRQVLAATGTSLLGLRYTNQTSWVVAELGVTGDKSSVIIEIQNPQTAKQTTFLSTNAFNFTGTGAFYETHCGFIANTSQYNGFTISNATNMAGTISIYGYNK
jgi:hypothetical protein